MMLFPNGILDFNRIRRELSFNEDPPTLYSIMESIVNYDKIYRYFVDGYSKAINEYLATL